MGRASESQLWDSWLRYRILLPGFASLKILDSSANACIPPPTSLVAKVVDGRFAHDNWFPFLASCFIGAKLLPKLLRLGLKETYKQVSARLGIPTLRHLRTMWICGELEWLESLSGLMTHLLFDRSVLFVWCLCLVAYRLFPITEEDHDGEDKESEGTDQSAQSAQSNSSSAVEQRSRRRCHSPRDMSQATTIIALEGSVTDLSESDLDQVLAIASSHDCRFVLRNRKPCQDLAMPTSLGTASTTPLVELDGLRDAVPSGYTTVGVLLGQSQFGLPLTSYVHPHNALYVLSRDPAELKWCRQLVHLADQAIPTVVSSLFAHRADRIGDDAWSESGGVDDGTLRESPSNCNGGGVGGYEEQREEEHHSSAEGPSTPQRFAASLERHPSSRGSSRVSSPAFSGSGMRKVASRDTNPLVQSPWSMHDVFSPLSPGMPS